MSEFLPEQLREWSGGRWTGPAAGPVRGFAFDSRRLQPGDLFICLTTDTRDGHEFIPQAAAAGAAGALVRQVRADIDLPQLVVEDPLAALGDIAAGHRRRFKGPVVAVTGSCGKTSTKDLLALLLGGTSVVHATRGNFNNLIGVPLTLLGLDPEHHQTAVIEAGINQVDEMAALARIIQPTHGIVTMIAAAHLELLGSLEGVAREKARILHAVPVSGAVVFPACCLRYAAFHHIPASVYPVGTDADATARADTFYRVEQRSGSTVLHLTCDRAGQVFTLRKVSAGMASNAALAIRMARVLGVSDHEIQERLLHWAPACFRGEVVEHGMTRFYVDCYNANPAAMVDALGFFDELSAEADRRMYVIGCMAELGEDSASYHRDLGGRINLRAQDRILITGQQDVEALREGLLAAGNTPAQITVFDRIEEIEDEVGCFEGFVFIKGSRIYRLETLVERVAERVGRSVSC